MAVSDVQKLKRLEEENSKLKRVVADLTLDIVVSSPLFRNTAELAYPKNRNERLPFRNGTTSPRERSTGHDVASAQMEIR